MPDKPSSDDPDLDQRKKSVLKQIEDIEAKLEDDTDDEFAEDQEAHLQELQEELRTLQGEQKAARGKTRSARRATTQPASNAE